MNKENKLDPPTVSSAQETPAIYLCSLYVSYSLRVFFFKRWCHFELQRNMLQLSTKTAWKKILSVYPTMSSANSRERADSLFQQYPTHHAHFDQLHNTTNKNNSFYSFFYTKLLLFFLSFYPYIYISKRKEFDCFGKKRRKELDIKLGSRLD